MLTSFFLIFDGLEADLEKVFSFLEMYFSAYPSSEVRKFLPVLILN
jgi:hypothetical protein